MISKSILRKNRRLRDAVIKKIFKTVKKTGNRTDDGYHLALSEHVVVDSATEIHLRHIRGLIAGRKKNMQAIVFDNYDESVKTYPINMFNTETLMGILDII